MEGEKASVSSLTEFIQRSDRLHRHGVDRQDFPAVNRSDHL